MWQVPHAKKRKVKEMCQKKEHLPFRKKKITNIHKAPRAAAARASFMKNINTLKKQKNERSEAITKALNSLPALQQVAFENSLRQVEAKRPQGIRYTREWIMNCLLLRIASPKAYNLLRSMKLLALPTCSRLNQIISGVPCEYGYKQIALETGQTFFKGLPTVEKYGTLVIHEIKPRPSLDLNKSTYKFDGFVDFGG